MNTNMRMTCRRKAAGLTLVELLVVVTIVGILGAIAYPGYKNQVVKTHRSAAKACLAQYASQLERFYTTNLTYSGSGAMAQPPCTTEGGMGQRYTFGVTGISATAFTLTATRTNDFAARDTRCGNLTLDQANQRGVSTGTLAECWN